MGEFKNQEQGFLASNVSGNTVNSTKGYSKFEVKGMIEWGKKKKETKKIPRPSSHTPKKSRNRKFQTPKNPSIHPRHLKSGLLHMGSTFALQTPRYNGHPSNTDSSWITDWNKLQV